MRPPRRTGSAMDQAEAAFKAATSKPVEAAPKTKAIPEGKEMVTLRLDRAVLEHFQDDGPGWQDRINDALRVVAGLEDR
ncbi:MAG: BrnA antitoxin family protein [Devosia sp.]